jgi:polar amino acid transport system substrate-binding protein
MRKDLWLIAVAAFAASCASMDADNDAVRQALAPTGKLRAGMNLQNTLFTTKAPSGELQGVSVDVMQELGRRLGVPVEWVMYTTPGDVADDAASGKWDATILAIEASRASTIAFSPPITEIVATYMVPPGSKLARVEDVDAPGIRIAVSEKAGYELYLSKALKHAELVKVRGTTASMDAFRDRKLDAVASLKPFLLEYQSKYPGAKVLDGRFMTVNHGVGTPQGRPQAARYLDRYVKDLVASGFIARSIARHRVVGLGAVRP